MVKPYNTDRTKKEEVRGMFDNIAPRYDLLNHTLSLSIDRLWRRRAVDIVCSGRPRLVVDVATGTGDLAIAMARRMPGAEILGVDLSERMLDVARRKVAARGLEGRIRLEAGDAEHLALADAEADAVTVAFGVRNFGDLGAGLRELYRTIKPGGRVVILEFSRPRNRLFRSLYEFYSRRVLPRIGGLISRDRRAYEYLPASVGEFPAPAEFLAMLAGAGFRDCRARSQSFGIAQIYIGEKRKVNFAIEREQRPLADSAEREQSGAAAGGRRHAECGQSEVVAGGKKEKCKVQYEPMRRVRFETFVKYWKNMKKYLLILLMLAAVLPIGSCRRAIEKAQRNIRFEGVEAVRRQGLTGAEVVVRVKNDTGYKLLLKDASVDVFHAGSRAATITLREPVEVERHTAGSVQTLWQLKIADPLALYLLAKNFQSGDVSRVAVTYSVEGRGGPAPVKISREMVPLSDFLNIFGLTLQDVKNYLK